MRLGHTLRALLYSIVAGCIVAQPQTGPSQRIQLQFKDSTTYKKSVEVEVKTAVLIRRTSSDPKKQSASFRIVLSNLESDLCSVESASQMDVKSPIVLSTDSDFVLSFSAGAASKQDITQTDLYKLFHAAKPPDRTFWVALGSGDADKLFPNERLLLTNPDRSAPRTDVIPRGTEGKQPLHLIVEKMTSSWFLYHPAIKKGFLTMPTSHGHAIIWREGDHARIRYWFAGGSLTIKVESEGDLNLRMCPNIVIDKAS